MIVGLLRAELHLPTTASLKDKRSVLKRLLHRLRNKQNVAAAELDDLDLWRRAVIGAVTLSNSRQVAESVLRDTLREIEITENCEVLEQRIEFL
jgi:uncharacterized protein YlxP (DUF503 family)